MISTLRLQNFRSYRDSSFEFDPNVNIVVGPNASGKTNLLEAILVLANGRSYRGRDVELVRVGAPWVRLDGWFGPESRTVKIKSEISEGTTLRSTKRAKSISEGRTLGVVEKTFMLGDKPFKRLSLERTVPVVLFEPNHLQLVSRGPQSRRDYFDDILERTEPGFKTLAGHYRRTLAQRNALLKQPAARVHQQLFAWDVRLSELGGKIAASRSQLVSDINKSISRTYGQIAGKRTKVELIYQLFTGAAPDTGAAPVTEVGHYSSRLLKKLEASTELDMLCGFTGYGPHREDITIMLKGQPAAASASRGEVRSLILALKVYELKLLEKKRGAKPIFLLDDVFSELDGSRRRHLVEHLKGFQTIITTTDADSVMHYFSKEKLLPI